MRFILNAITLPIAAVAAIDSFLESPTFPQARGSNGRVYDFRHLYVLLSHLRSEIT